MGAPPSMLTVTVPCGVPPLPATVTVKFTVWPKLAPVGSGAEVVAVVVLALRTICVTVEPALIVLALKFGLTVALMLYWAVMV